MSTILETFYDEKRPLPEVTKQFFGNDVVPPGFRHDAYLAALCQCRDCRYTTDEMECPILDACERDASDDGHMLRLLKSVYQTAPRASILPDDKIPKKGGKVKPVKGVGGKKNGPSVMPSSAPKESTTFAEKVDPLVIGYNDRLPLPEPVEHGLIIFAQTAFREDEYIAICEATPPNNNGKSQPRTGAELWVRSADLVSQIYEMDSVADVLGCKYGYYVRVNPMHENGSTDNDVAVYRHLLVEFDSRVLEQQWFALVQSRLPISVVMFSGDKSLHGWVRLDAPNAEEFVRRQKLVWQLFQGFSLDPANRNPSRYSRLPGVQRMVKDRSRRNGDEDGDGIPVTQADQTLIATNIGMTSWDEWEREFVKDSAPAFVGAGTLTTRTDIPIRPEIIIGILRNRCKMFLNAPSKARKTYNLLRLALGITNGADWMGLKTVKGKVLYINWELHLDELTKRLNWISSCTGLEITDDLVCWNLRVPGMRPKVEEMLQTTIRRIHRSKEKYSVIIIDPLYKLLGDRDENSNTAMADLMAQLEDLCASADSSLVVAHHFAKGNPWKKDALDRQSGAGVFGRDPDCLVVMTPDKPKKKDEDGEPIEPEEVAGFEKPSDDGNDIFLVQITLREFAPVPAFKVQWQEAELVVIEENVDPDEVAARNTEEKPGRKMKVTAYQILALIPDEGIRPDKWAELAIRAFMISPATFLRRARDLANQGLIERRTENGVELVFRKEGGIPSHPTSPGKGPRPVGPAPTSPEPAPAPDPRPVPTILDGAEPDFSFLPNGWGSRVTPYFKHVLKFAAERQRILEKRLRHEPAPWTTDPVFEQVKFCNPFRVSDRASQFLVREVQNGAGRSQEPSEIFFRTLLLRLFNLPSTFELIESTIGAPITYDLFLENHTKLNTALSAAMTAGVKIFSPAYRIVNFGGFKVKHEGRFQLLRELMHRQAWKELQAAGSYADAARIIDDWPTFGDFLGFQLLVDMNYTNLIDFNENDFVIAGPGCHSGFNPMFGLSVIPERPSPADHAQAAELIRMMVDYQDPLFAAIEEAPLRLDGWRPLKLIDIQNIMGCEASKYLRVRFPGSVPGKTQNKNSYKVKQARPLDPLYLPPKWIK